MDLHKDVRRVLLRLLDPLSRYVMCSAYGTETHTIFMHTKLDILCLQGKSIDLVNHWFTKHSLTTERMKNDAIKHGSAVVCKYILQIDGRCSEECILAVHSDNIKTLKTLISLGYLYDVSKLLRAAIEAGLVSMTEYILYSMDGNAHIHRVLGVRMIENLVYDGNINMLELLREYIFSKWFDAHYHSVQRDRPLANHLLFYSLSSPFLSIDMVKYFISAGATVTPEYISIAEKRHPDIAEFLRSCL